MTQNGTGQALRTDFPAAPEEKAAIEKALLEPWDTNGHIAKLFERIQDQLTDLADMSGNPTCAPEQFIHCTHMAVYETRQFDKECSKWKNLPEAQRNTEALCREYFQNKFDAFDAQRDSLRDAGIANNAEIEQDLAAMQQQNALMQHRIDQLENASDQTGETTPSTEQSSMVSKLGAMSAQQEFHAKQLAELKEQNEKLIAQLASMSGTKPPAPKKETQKQPGQRPTANKKTKKFYNNENACFTHGYDVSAKHDGKTCRNKCTGHIDWHAGGNPAPGHNPKDLEFSKWATIPANKDKAGDKAAFR